MSVHYISSYRKIWIPKVEILSCFPNFVTGMMHLMDHEKVSEDLEELRKTEGLDVQLSYDGLRVPVML